MNRWTERLMPHDNTVFCVPCKITNYQDVAIEMLHYQKGYWQYICVFMIIHVHFLYHTQKVWIKSKKGIKLPTYGYSNFCLWWRSPPVFSGVRVAGSVVFCCPFPSQLLPLWYLQTWLLSIPQKQHQKELAPSLYKSTYFFTSQHVT